MLCKILVKLAGILTIGFIKILVVFAVCCHLASGAIGVRELIRAKWLISILSLKAAETNSYGRLDIDEREWCLGWHNLDLEVKGGFISLVGSATHSMSGHTCQIALFSGYWDRRQLKLV